MQTIKKTTFLNGLLVEIYVLGRKAGKIFEN